MTEVVSAYPGLTVNTTPSRRVCRPIEVTRLGDAEPAYLCTCGRDHTPKPPPVCICGDSGTHRPEPGIGCTRPGCLCLEPAEPTPRPPSPPDTSWLKMERIR